MCLFYHLDELGLPYSDTYEAHWTDCRWVNVLHVGVNSICTTCKKPTASGSSSVCKQKLVIKGLCFLQEVSTVVLGLARVPRPLRRLSSLLLSHLPSLTVVVHTLLSLSRTWALYKGTTAYSVQCYVCVGSEWFVTIFTLTLLQPAVTACSKYL